jgi:hypothetical protein
MPELMVNPSRRAFDYPDRRITAEDFLSAGRKQKLVVSCLFEIFPKSVEYTLVIPAD